MQVLALLPLVSLAVVGLFWRGRALRYKTALENIRRVNPRDYAADCVAVAARALERR